MDLKGEYESQHSMANGNCVHPYFLQEAQGLLSKMSVKVKKEPTSPETWAA